MVLNQRDLELLNLLARSAVLTTKQINDRVFRGIDIRTVLRRLRKLEKEKLVARALGLPNYEVAWHLTLKGADAVGYINPKRNFHVLNLSHDVKLNALRFILEDQGISRSWIPEHEIRSQMARRYGLSAMKNRSVPDGLMGVFREGINESVAIELELNYKNKDRYRNIFRSYAEKKNIKAVWYLVLKKQMGEHLTKLWKQHTHNYGPWFFWSLVDDLEKNGSKATIYCHHESYLIEELFKKSAALEPAHKNGFEVSKADAELSAETINLTPEDQKEIPEKAS